MKVSNEVYKKVTIDWANVTLPLKEGSPVSSAGVVANSGSAFGIVPQNYFAEPLEKSIYVLVGGHVDLNEIETLYGSSYDDAAISALNGIHFYKNGKSIDYTLPKASVGTLGGIKVGSGLSIESDGTLSASGGGGVLYARLNPDSEALYDELDVTWKEVNDAVQSNKNVAYIFDDGYQYFIIPLYLVQTPNAEHQISYYWATFAFGSDTYEFYADSENGYLHTID